MHVVRHDNIRMQEIVTKFAAPLDRILDVPCDFGITQPSRTCNCCVQPQISRQDPLVVAYGHRKHMK